MKFILEELWRQKKPKNLYCSSSLL